MRAQEFITEVFEPGKQNWKWRRQSSDEAFASFVVGDREYQWHAFSSEANPAKWEIQFRLMRVPADPDGLDLFGQTGTGNSAEVLSTAVDITRSFLQNYGLDKVEEITFNAKEDSRINLYAKMIKRLLPNWELSSRKSLSHGMQFTLTDPRAYDKPENKINEIKATGGTAVEELKAALVACKQKLQSASDDQVYDSIDKIMTRIAKTHNISGQKLHDMWVDKYHAVPDTWIMKENFADGKKPGRKGLAKRVGVNCKQPVSKLRSIAANSSGERQRMAHWCANMKSGKKK